MSEENSIANHWFDPNVAASEGAMNVPQANQFLADIAQLTGGSYDTKRLTLSHILDLLTRYQIGSLESAQTPTLMADRVMANIATATRALQHQLSELVQSQAMYYFPLRAQDEILMLVPAPNGRGRPEAITLEQIHETALHVVESMQAQGGVDHIMERLERNVLELETISRGAASNVRSSLTKLLDRASELATQIEQAPLPTHMKDAHEYIKNLMAENPPYKANAYTASAGSYSTAISTP